MNRLSSSRQDAGQAHSEPRRVVVCDRSPVTSRAPSRLRRIPSGFFVESGFAWLLLLTVLLCSPLEVGAQSIDADIGRRDAIAWLESAQNDPDWLDDRLEPLARAEVLTALARAQRCDTPQAERGIDWIRNRNYVSTDYPDFWPDEPA